MDTRVKPEYDKIMDYVITCLAAGETLDASFAESTAAALAAQGLRVARHGWPEAGRIAEFCVDSGQWTADRLSAFFAVHCPPPTDYVIRPAPTRHYKLLISDMDSTMITCECIDELADFAGKKAEVADVTARAMNGELDFESALAARVALLAGLPETVLERCYHERVKLMPGAKELLAVHKEAGGYSVLVSGGFTFFTSRVAKALGFDEHHGNRLDIAGGKLTGRVIPPILGKDAKLATLHAACKKQGVTTQDALAIGDGANDLPMLLAAGLGIAYHAKPSVQAQAKACIRYGDLRAIIPLLG